MRKRVNWKNPSIIGLLISLPFVIVASYSWLICPIFTVSHEAYWFGDQIYKLGFPLTGIILYFPEYSGRFLTNADNWWALPLIDILFILQWIIWSYVGAFFLRKYRERQHNNRINQTE